MKRKSRWWRCESWLGKVCGGTGTRIHIRWGSCLGGRDGSSCSGAWGLGSRADGGVCCDGHGLDDGAVGRAGADACWAAGDSDNLGGVHDGSDQVLGRSGGAVKLVCRGNASQRGSEECDGVLHVDESNDCDVFTGRSGWEE